jgi:hypothetical protein
MQLSAPNSAGRASQPKARSQRRIISAQTSMTRTRKADQRMYEATKSTFDTLASKGVR